MKNFWILSVFVTADSPARVVDLSITIGDPHKLLEDKTDIKKTTIIFAHL